LPPLPLLRARLHQAIEHARESAARRLLALDKVAPPKGVRQAAPPVRATKPARKKRQGQP